MAGPCVNLADWLAEFVAARRGLRLGTMFGAPAAYAGRRLFACIVDNGLVCKLPDDVLREQLRAHRGRPFVARGRMMTGWIVFDPRTAIAIRRLEPTLELAARFVAEAPAATETRRRSSARPPMRRAR